MKDYTVNPNFRKKKVIFTRWKTVRIICFFLVIILGISWNLHRRFRSPKIPEDLVIEGCTFEESHDAICITSTGGGIDINLLNEDIDIIE